MWLSSSYFSWNIHPLTTQSVTSLPLGPSSLADVVWCCLKAIQIGDCLLRCCSGLYSLCLRLFPFFLKLLEALTWEEIIWSGEQVWTDEGLLGCGIYLPASYWRLLPAHSSVWYSSRPLNCFCFIRDCLTWKHDSRCQIWLSLSCCNLHLMVLMGTACQLHWELRESLKLLRERLLVNHRLSRPAFLCGYLMEVELKSWWCVCGQLSGLQGLGILNIFSWMAYHGRGKAREIIAWAVSLQPFS